MEKLLKNIIENPDDPKYRSIKKENTKLKDLITKYKNGHELLLLVSFKLVTESEEGGLAKQEQFYKISPTLDTQYLKGVRLDL